MMYAHKSVAQHLAAFPHLARTGSCRWGIRL
jgi:hypothetical protein